VMSDLRDIEHKSIKEFVQRACDMGYVTGRVLDWGCGKQPYREVIEETGAEYEGYDLAEFPANLSGEDVGADLFWDPNAWDTILCTQVIQYVPLVHDFVSELHSRLFTGGYLVMTYPTNWPEVEPDDLHRFTMHGMNRLLEEERFEIFHHERRHGFEHSGVSFSCGYGVVARA